ncbi:MAG: hypothetical protein HC930_14105 [Hydrococcus sp. SU_1_0]|nr:hypothetical protein [Hydrococcus sp. SU_1_0]
MSDQTNRRNFILGSVAAATAIGYKAITQNSESIAASQFTSSMPERILGKTNISLPILGLGGSGKTPISQRGQDKRSDRVEFKKL